MCSSHSVDAMGSSLQMKMLRAKLEQHACGRDSLAGLPRDTEDIFDLTLAWRRLKTVATTRDELARYVPRELPGIVDGYEFPGREVRHLHG